MMMSERDLTLLETLTVRVSLLTTVQIAEHWWPCVRSLRPARGRLARLRNAGWIKQAIVNVQPVTCAHAPLVAWKPGAEAPDPVRTAQRAHSRWASASQPAEVWFATERAAYLIGSIARGLPPREQRDHILRLAEVYFHYLHKQPRLGSLWTGRHALPRAGYGRKDVDALLRNDTGRILRVIHVAGRWQSRQVESFHEYCAQWHLTYELW